MQSVCSGQTLYKENGNFIMIKKQGIKCFNSHSLSVHLHLCTLQTDMNSVEICHYAWLNFFFPK